VTLHIYDAVGDARVQLVNELLRPVGAGAFHAGVEIYGQEWSFGCREDGDAGTGIFSCDPRQSTVHRYREQVRMSSTFLSNAEVLELIDRLKAEWPGRSYDLVSRNCCHFCDVFCRALGVGPLPPWVTNLAGTSASLLSSFQAIQSSSFVQSLQEVWNSVNVELECVVAEGVKLTTLRPDHRCIYLRISPDKPAQVGPRHQPEVFSHLSAPDSSVLQAAEIDDHLFSLGWQPPCLFVRKPSADVPLAVNGRTFSQMTYVLLRNAEIGLVAEAGGKPCIAFRVHRPSATSQVTRVLAKWS